MKRIIYDELVAWKEQTERKPLVLQGVRQCGKTYALKHFGRTSFKSVAYFNFERDSHLREVFDYDFDCSRILNELALLKKYPAITPETLVIFDEIQECPRAITSLKYFCEEMPQMFIASAGSLLGPALRHHNISFPVGKVTFLRMYPLSFGEFAVACGAESELDFLSSLSPDRLIPDAIAEKMKSLYATYLVVGGMPEAVKAWIERRDFNAVDKILADISESYSNDFGKYLSAPDALKVEWIWDSMPVQLSKDNNKFIFSHVKEGKRSAELEDALQWLIKADLAFPLYLVTNPEMPLSFYSDVTYFKLYMSDVGLLRHKCGLSAETVINETPLYNTFKGAFTENFVMNELVKLGVTPYFWRSSNSAEVDFIIEQNRQVIPIEAKAGINTRAKSYALYCSRYNPPVGVKFSLKNLGTHVVDNTLTYSIPNYLIPRIKKIGSPKE